MSVIVPSVLEDSIERFISRVATITKFPGVKRIQIDLADGKFTDRTTISASDIDLLNPMYTWEAHLMVQNPSEILFDLQLAGFNAAIVHFESFQDQSEIQRIASEIRKMKMSPGLAIRPETDINAIRSFVQYFDQVLVLSVHPGFQGQEFLESTYQKVQTLRSWNLSAKIEVDGGVKLEQAGRLAEMQTDYIVVGSALFDLSGATLSASENFERFQQAALK